MCVYFWLADHAFQDKIPTGLVDNFKTATDTLFGSILCTEIIERISFFKIGHVRCVSSRAQIRYCAWRDQTFWYMLI